jgi:hypothetical protein
MGWSTLTAAETAPRQPLDSELFTRIIDNLQFLKSLSAGNRAYIPNGSFEVVSTAATATALQWTFTSVSASATSVTSTDAAHGSRSLTFRYDGGAGGGYVMTDDYIPVTTCAGVDYLMSAIVKQTATNSTWYIQAHYYNKDFATVSVATILDGPPGYLNFQKVSATFVAPTTAKWMKIAIGLPAQTTRSASVHFDNVVLTER